VKGIGLRATRVLSVALLVFLLVATANPAVAVEQLEWNGYVEEAYARRVEKNEDAIYHRQTLNAKLTGEFSDFADFRFEASLWRDDADFQEGDDYEARVLEAYIRFRFERFDLRVGRMQIGWGESDGIVISDQVSPFDLTNFVVPSFDAIRMGVDGATVDYYFDDGSDLQLIWIARFQIPDYPEVESPWSFIDAEELAAQGIELGGTASTPDSLRNSEFGARYSRHPLWADWSLGYFHSRDDRPTPRLRGNQLVLTHDFYDLASFNFVAPIGESLVRIDSAYEIGRFLPLDPRNPEASGSASAGFVDRHDLWRTMLGVDIKPNLAWWPQANAAFRLIHEQVVDPNPALLDRREADFASVRLMAGYRNETIKPFLFWVQNARGADSWLQVKVDYEGFDNWRLSLEYDLFQGHDFSATTNNGGNFGRFAGNDLIQATVRRSF
jgi:hypothetical protein